MYTYLPTYILTSWLPPNSSNASLPTDKRASTSKIPSWPSSTDTFCMCLFGTTSRCIDVTGWMVRKTQWWLFSNTILPGSNRFMILQNRQLRMMLVCRQYVTPFLVNLLLYPIPFVVIPHSHLLTYSTYSSALLFVTIYYQQQHQHWVSKKKM